MHGGIRTPRPLLLRGECSTAALQPWPKMRLLILTSVKVSNFRQNLSHTRNNLTTLANARDFKKGLFLTSFQIIHWIGTMLVQTFLSFSRSQR